MTDRRAPRPSALRLPDRISLFAYSLMLPTVLVVVGVIGYPFLFSVYISFTDRMVGSAGNWVGLDNFLSLFRAASFQTAIVNTVLIVVVSCALKLVIGLSLALALTRDIFGRSIMRLALMLPWAMPTFVAYLAWRSMFQPIGGGINVFLHETGLYPHMIDWLGQKSTAMISVIVAAVWRGFPFWFVSILAALQSIPKDLYEAAEIDGANGWDAFWAVTWPSILPVVLVTTLVSSIATANAFEHVWLLTQGGPSDATMVFPVLAYSGMQTQRIGEAAAVSVSMFPVLIVLVIMTTRLITSQDDNE